MERSINQRYLSSQDKIQKSILELLESYDPGKITISLICKKANINRSTFYSYYKSFDDLLENLEADMTNKLLSIYTKDFTFTREFLYSDDFLLPLLQFIKDHRSFVMFYLENRQSYPFGSRFQFLWDEITIPFANQQNIDSKEDLLYYFIYFQAGVFMIIKHWIKTSCKESTTHMARIIQNCILRNLTSVPDQES